MSPTRPTGTLGDPGVAVVHRRLLRQHQPGRELRHVPDLDRSAQRLPQHPHAGPLLLGLLHVPQPGHHVLDLRRQRIDVLGLLPLQHGPAGTGSGGDFWNVVGIRTGTDGTSFDDDTFLAPNRYFSTVSRQQQLQPADQRLPRGQRQLRACARHRLLPADPQLLQPRRAVLDRMGRRSHHPRHVRRRRHELRRRGPRVRHVPGHCNDVLHRAPARRRQHLELQPPLHSASGTAEQGRPSAVANSGNVAPGSPALISYATGADPSQYDGIVVVNNNSGSGTYTLYRDTAAPTGTIKIDGGANYTNRTSLALTLSATNPTAGDPVSDMAFSINGGAFGAFGAYSTSTTLTVPGGDGIKTVAVEFRNGAGAISAQKSASITLDQTGTTRRPGATGQPTAARRRSWVTSPSR